MEQLKNVLKLCKCGKPTRSPGQRYCLKCHAEYMKNMRDKAGEIRERVKKLVNKAWMQSFTI